MIKLPWVFIKLLAQEPHSVSREIKKLSLEYKKNDFWR